MAKLSPIQAKVLDILQNDLWIRNRMQIARRLGICHQDVYRAVHDLQRKGYIPKNHSINPWRKYHDSDTTE
jgi:DNA-binding IclR family transcriptional regulator